MICSLYGSSERNFALVFGAPASSKSRLEAIRAGDDIDQAHCIFRSLDQECTGVEAEWKLAGWLDQVIRRPGKKLAASRARPAQDHPSSQPDRAGWYDTGHPVTSMSSYGV